MDHSIEKVSSKSTMPKVKDQGFDLASVIDHTQLKPDTSASDIVKLCEEAKAHGFFSVCVSPWYVSLARELIDESPTKLCTVIGFPHGNTTTEVKAYEAAEALRMGADELDMVLNIGALRAKNYLHVQRDILAVSRLCRTKTLKVIIECSLLNDQEKIIAATLVKAAGAHFVKTSTGFAGGGATVEDVRLLREVVGPDFGVKASGGVRDRATAEALITAGATRLGASSSVAIVTANLQERSEGY